ncbi:MAG: FHA domain-containing protein [Phycisphaerae bacterium]|nr:FHA domain-containing protein [Phycisphaerae bacterium]
MAVVLVYFNKNNHQKTIPVGTGTLIIGRRPDCDIQVPDVLVSRQHCRVVHNGQALFIQDLGTPNGTYVNEERVDKVELNPGDVIKVGPIQFVVQVDGQPVTITPPAKSSEHVGSDSSSSHAPVKKGNNQSASESDVLGADILAELGLDPDD